MIADALKKLARLFWILPGFLLWASFPPMAEKTDCVFALAPLLWLARNKDAKTNFCRWFLNGFVFWFATLSWMPAIVKNGGPWPLVVLGWGALAAYCALYFGAFGWLSAKVWAWAKDEGSPWRKPPRFPYARRLFAILVAEPLLWCGLELVRSRFLGGFSWNHLGLPLVNANLGSPAALGGVYLVSAVVILVNGTIAGIAERIMKRTTRWASLETLIPFLLIWGLYALEGSAARRMELWEKEDCNVAMVQRNFPCVFKPAEREDPIAVYSNLLANVAYTRPDLVVLSESALSEFGAAADSSRALAFAGWVAKSTGAREVIAGGGRFADGKEYNSAILFSNLGMPSERLGDAPVPHSPFPVPHSPFPVVGSCTPGELKLLGDYGVAICYEDTDSAQMRALLHKGARALVFITNDSWFSDSIEAEQHSWQAVARAVETGLPVIRVGNSGVTGTIDPRGKASWLSRADGRPLVDARGTMCDTVTKLSPPCPTMSPVTFYGTVGDMPLSVSFALLIILMVLVKYKDTYEKRRYMSM